MALPKPAEFLYSNVFDPITTTLQLESSGKRFAFFTSFTALILWITKPEAVFDATGDPREWKVVSINRSATIAPWYVISFVSGLIGALFL
jgi:hypothetical protein